MFQIPSEKHTNNAQYMALPPQVEILSHSHFRDSLGWFHIVGEVQNGLTSRIRFVKITATYYDAGNTVIDTSFTYTSLDILLSDQKTPFEILLLRDVAVDHYSLTASYSSTTLYPYRDFEILSHSSFEDIIGWLHVVGEIKNIGVQDATFVEVVCTFYDAGGGVVATSFTYTDPTDLSAGQTAPFEILLEKSLSNKVDSYSLQFQCNEYTEPPDETPPSISSIQHTPQNPKPDDQVTVSAMITDDSSGVESATLYYRSDSGAWSSKPMSKGSDTYSATIPAQEDGVTVNYYIKAADKAGNLGQSSTYSYTVKKAAEGRPAIPGFPIEAIMIGVLLATGVLIILRKPRGPRDL